MKAGKMSLVLAALVLAGGLAAHAQFALSPLKTIPVTPQEVKALQKVRAVIETRFGAITLRFFPDVAPVHVKNFVDLARSGFYDRTTFHRVMPGFMIQGGDPTTKDPARRGAAGTGGPGYTIKAEFNSRPHKRGALSMARTNVPDSAGSQFFICLQMDPRQQQALDGNYTVFGEVVSGMDVVEKIVSQPRDMRDNPNDRIEMKVRIIEAK